MTAVGEGVGDAGGVMVIVGVGGTGVQVALDVGDGALVGGTVAVETAAVVTVGLGEDVGVRVKVMLGVGMRVG
ncbi:MAG: hypothetical protein ACUVWB_10790, partial [Anaerolineae bacterium]